MYLYPPNFFPLTKLKQNKVISSLDSIIIFKNIILDVKVLRDKISFSCVEIYKQTKKIFNSWCQWQLLVAISVLENT